MTDRLKTLPKAVAETLLVMVNNEMEPGGKYDPFNADNLAEAMCEATPAQYEQLAGLMRANDPVAITAAIHLITREYWFEYACRILQSDAEDEVADASDYNPCAMEAWERDLPPMLRPQVHW